MSRVSWDDYFLNIANVTKTRSTCLRRQVGAVVVSQDKTILTTGYNGAPKRCKHCDETGCMRQVLKIPSGERHEICRAAHAEMNAVAQAASKGICLEGSTIYITNAPCVICAKIMINAGIKKVVYSDPYPDSLAKTLLQEAGIKVVHHNAIVPKLAVKDISGEIIRYGRCVKCDSIVDEATSEYCLKCGTLLHWPVEVTIKENGDSFSECVNQIKEEE